jgi:hypothetical protein
MSQNYRFYTQKVTASRARRVTARSLSEQLTELLDTVRWCEKVWAIEDRMDREIRSA